MQPRNRMGLDDSKVMLNIQKYGNTTNGNDSTLSLGLGKEIEERRQPDSCSFRWWIYLGKYLGEMGNLIHSCYTCS